MNNNAYLKNVIPFVDVLFALLMVFMVMSLLMRADSKKVEAAYQQSAAYLIVLTWEGNADLDLWVQDPVGHKVGFNRREGGDGSMLSLNRDCLGAKRTETDDGGVVYNKINEEIVSIRGIAPGEYIVNVHAYNLNHAPVPLKAKVKLVKVRPFGEAATEEKDFQETGNELTFFRFILQKDGTITSISRDLPLSILNSAGGGPDLDQPETQEPQTQEP